MGWFSNLWHGMVLRDQTSTDKGYVSSDERLDLLGCTGIVKNELRPAGTVLIGDNPIDVVSEGDFIRKGATVKVVAVVGGRVVVRSIE